MHWVIWKKIVALWAKRAHRVDTKFELRKPLSKFWGPSPTVTVFLLAEVTWWVARWRRKCSLALGLAATRGTGAGTVRRAIYLMSGLLLTVSVADLENGRAGADGDSFGGQAWIDGRVERDFALGSSPLSAPCPGVRFLGTTRLLGVFRTQYKR